MSSDIKEHDMFDKRWVNQGEYIIECPEGDEAKKVLKGDKGFFNYITELVFYKINRSLKNELEEKTLEWEVT